MNTIFMMIVIGMLLILLFHKPSLEYLIAKLKEIVKWIWDKLRPKDENTDN